MDRRRYYSQRTSQTRRLNLDDLKKLFYHVYTTQVTEGYFDQLYGRGCNDNNFEISTGAVGASAESFFFLRLRKDNLHPIPERYRDYTEEDLFDVVELLYDHAQKRHDSAMRHNWCSCGGCEATYDKTEGRREYRSEINDLLRDYLSGYELTEQGEIRPLVAPALKRLLTAPLPALDRDNIESKVEVAVGKFLSRRSSDLVRREAVRELADVLEFLRPQIKLALLSKDEQALFQIANSFGIRHHNASQMTDYDGPVWLGWVFFIYLATIRAVTSVVKRQAGASDCTA